MASNGAEQILRLMSELIESGTDREMTIGHHEPPLKRPGVRRNRAKEVRQNQFLDQSGGLSPARGPVASCTPSVSMLETQPICKNCGRHFVVCPRGRCHRAYSFLFFLWSPESPGIWLPPSPEY